MLRPSTFVSLARVVWGTEYSFPPVLSVLLCPVRRARVTRQSFVTVEAAGGAEYKMIRVLSLASFLVLASSSGWGDTIVLGSGSLANVPTSISNPSVGVTGCGITVQCGYLGTGPYWDNLSGDGTAPNNQMNVGYILTGTCSVTADCPTDYDPLQYLSQNNGAGNPNSPSSISLLNTSSSPRSPYWKFSPGMETTRSATITRVIQPLARPPLPRLPSLDR